MERKKGLSKEKKRNRVAKVKNTVEKNKGKVIASIVAVLGFLMLVMVGIYQSENSWKKGISAELAKAMTYEQVEKGEEAVEGTDNVKFDAFFLRDINNDGYAEGIRGTCKEIGKEDTLYMELNVLTQGALENGVITVEGDNFYLQTAIPKDNEIKENAIGNNVRKIELNTINNGTQKLLTGIVRSGDYSSSYRKAEAIGNDTNKYNRVNSVTLRGTYVAENGTKTNIEKTVNFNMDWYGLTKAEIPSYALGRYNIKQTRDNTNIVDEEKRELNLEFEIITQEKNNELILKSSNLEGEIPELSGYAPTKVEITGTDVTYEYDETTRKFTARRESVINEKGIVTSQCYDGTNQENRYNKYKIKVTYPIEAYQAVGSDTVEIRIPVKTYYEGYNNTSGEFNNPHQSNIATASIVVTYKKPEGTVAIFDITVGKYVYTPTGRYMVSKEKPLKIYNGISEEENNDTYIVRWYGSTGSNGAVAGMTMKETKTGEGQVSDQFIKNDATSISMKEVTTNVGIYFGNPINLLGENGWIKVYNDETGDLIETFTKENWTRYTEKNPYTYEIPVKHIRIETSETKANNSLAVYNVKKLDDTYITENYTREEFDNLGHIKSTLTGYIGESYINTDTHQAVYEAPYAIAQVSLSKNTISTQETEKNMKIKIDAKGDESANQVKWKNGAFLLKLPQNIVDIEINSVEVNDSSVNITGYEQYEENGINYIKIITENNNKTEYQITIDCNVTPDPRIPTTTGSIELYASNEEASDYYYKSADIYDVNGNLNKEEKVNKTTTNLSLVSPNSLLTNQTASNFDEAGSIVIAPKIANVLKSQRTANVNIEVNNNYTSSISEVKILGRIPFEGNKYTIQGSDMGSNFTTTMSNTGIVLPDALKGIAKVYYSEKGDATQDLNNQQNGWTTTPQDFSKVKSYLIDLGNHVLQKGEKFQLSYEINIPEGLNYNQVSYSHHAIYFSLDTEQGKYKTQTEPNKIGFMIAKQFDLELIKYQKNKEKVVPGATYLIKEKGTQEGKTKVTNEQGILKLEGLYLDKTYEIQEIKSPDEYTLNTDIVEFTTSEENGTLKVTKNAGNVKSITPIQAQEGKDYQVQVKVEDEAKANLKIKKVEQGTITPIKNVKYKVTGAELPETGKIITTDNNGETSIKGLKIGEIYTLEETKAEGYYLASPIKFQVVNKNGTYDVSVQEGTVKTKGITTENEIPTINLNIEDEKIPTYNLQIAKIKKTTESTLNEDKLIAKAESDLASTEIKYLEGAKFKLYKGNKEIGEYITDNTGKIAIEGLYQYEASKNIDQTYTLKEVLAPDGYAKVKDITFKVQKQEGILKFQEEAVDGQTAKNYTVEGNTIKLTIEDAPSFKLIKKDAETKAPLANIKFAIYNVDSGEEPALNSKGEILGTKETINGREYNVLTTNANGEITADLQEGLYKAVEIQAPDKYDISKATYYFGIGASREGKTEIVAERGDIVGGSYENYIYSVVGTSDGGYIVGGSFGGSGTLDLGNGIEIENKGYKNGIIIKYSSSGEIEWAKAIGGNNFDQINSVAETSDGGIIAGGSFKSSTIDLENGVKLNNNGVSDGMIIKYSSNGEVEWAKAIGGSYGDYISSVAETQNGGIIATGYFSLDTINLGNGVELNNNGIFDGMVIKYSSNGEVEWAKGIGGDNDDHINSVVETSDGGIIVGGYFKSRTINLGNGIELNNNDYEDGMIIKYSASGEVEWAKEIGGSSEEQINSVAETTDGGIIVGGYFYSSTIDLGNGIKLNNNSNKDGMIIKYSESGEVEWAKEIGGSSDEQINSVAETTDGGIIAGGTFYSSKIDLGNGIEIDNQGASDGIIIKYSSNGEVECAKVIGGVSNDYIYSVAETLNGNIIAGGRFTSSKIDLGNGVILSQNGSDKAMLIKLNTVQVPEVVIKHAKGIGGSSDDRIDSVAETSDGGYIAGGYFKSSTIDLGNGIKLKNYGNADGMIIKYSRNGEVEWAKEIGGSYEDSIKSVTETSDGGIIATGYFKSSRIDLGNGVKLNNYSNADGMIIKYSASGEVEWAKEIGGSSEEQINSVAETTDGGIIVGGYFYSSTIDLGNGIKLNNNSNKDGMIIKYSESGEAEWAKEIGGSNIDEINSVAETSDGGIIVGGNFSSSIIDLGSGIKLNNNGSHDGMIIKYSRSGEVEWAKGVGGSETEGIFSVAETKDGIIVGGNFYSSTIDLGNGIKLNGNGNFEGMIIKYSNNGEAEWAKEIGGTGSGNIYSVIGTEDGGIVVGGEFYSYSSTIDLGNEIKLKSNGNFDGMIIKYSSNGKTEWAKGIGGTDQECIYSVTEASDGGIIAGGKFYSSTIDLGNGVELNSNGSIDGMIIKVVPEMGVPEVQELTVENERKEFKITTDVKEIDGIKGGSISGEDQRAYETVKYGENSTKEIKMTPNENYEIIKITVNGEEYPFTTNADGSYTMPLFKNMTEDKHIEVTYSLKDNKIIINKVDSQTKEKLTGAKFKLDQIDERTKPTNVLGSLTPNGAEQVQVDLTNEITGALGELTNNGTYYFVEKDGTYVPTNSKTYQTANGGTAGKHNTTANSYIPINLTNETGKYVIVVDARVSSESNYDFGYATVTETQTAPSYNSTTGQIMKISGTVAANDYTSILLEGGKTYYLHLGYQKDGSGDTNEDQIVFNSIKVYGATTASYNFVNNKGKYESNNQGKDNTTANSYIPIDLTNNTGKYNLVVNAKVSSENSDSGYATVTQNTTRPAYNNSTGQFIYISGTSGENATAKDYTTVLQGGRMYYLHLGYYKNGSGSSGDDKFTVNSVKVTLNDSELYHTEVETNSKGQAITQIPFGKYQITETKAPEGYELNETPTEVEFRADGVHEFTIENQRKAKVIVHHYIKGTTTKVAEDEFLEGKINEDYTTAPHLDIEKYELQKDTNGNYITPSNATGKYQSGDQEVIYYYVKKEIPLTVHHYIEGTTIKVPLKNGSEAKDVISKGQEGENYQTQAIEDSLLSEAYELVEIPSNSKGIYEYPEIEVTYYYKLVERDFVLKKYQEDGTTLLEGAKFTIKAKGATAPIIQATTNAQGKIEATLEAGTYEVTEIEAPEGYQLPQNPTKEITINKATTTAEISLNNTQEKGNVIVHHYIKGTTTRVPSKEEGKVVADENKTGIVGEIYATKDSEDISEKYELVITPENASGIITKGTTEVIYYYDKKDTSVLVHHYIQGTTDRLSEDVTINGKVDQNYQTTVATDIPANYELVAEPENKNGTMTIEQIVVIYYYKLKDPEVRTTITKTSTTGKVTEPDQVINYTVNYQGTVDKYIGKATVTITDKLPYEIDISKSNLGNGTYNAANKTITWTENINDINTFTNGAKNINISKNIRLVYSNLDVTQAKVTNTVTGKIVLETPKKEETVETTKEIPAEYLTDVTATKTWDHTNNIYEKPTQVKIQLKNGNTIVREQIINQNNKVGNDENTWRYTFTGLPRYDSTGTRINYTIEEAEVNQGDLVYYIGTIEGLTIKNKYNGPIISQNKTQETEYHLPYVVEDEKITYTITVTNEGGVAKDVIVKDNIPEGTTFVPGSIKVNGEASHTTLKGETINVSTKTAADLKNGITIKVPEKKNNANGTTILSFEVTVNDLPNGIFTKELKNTAVVDNKNTNETTTIVKKPNITQVKEVTPNSGNKVKQGDTITYRIKLGNTGTAPGTVSVKDTIPTGTTFVLSSIKINNQSTYELNDQNTHTTKTVDLSTKTASDLQNGIDITVDVNIEMVLEFKVTVNDINDQDIIKNIATVGNDKTGDKPTNEVSHKYIEPIISGVKSMKTERAKEYVIEDEKITYTITVTNEGGLYKNAILKDTIPEGTTFVPGSIKVNGKTTHVITYPDINTGVDLQPSETIDLSKKTETDLKNGIMIHVPEKKDNVNGQVTITFEVTVNKDAEGDITNIAKIDEKPTNEVNIPMLRYEKTSRIIKKNTDIPTKPDEVTTGDSIYYTIKVINTGSTDIYNIEVKDKAPEGTKVKNVANQNTEIKWIVEHVPAGETREVGYEVEVQYVNQDFKIKNVATVEGKETNETEDPYVQPETILTSNLVKTGTSKVTSKDEKVYYEINFTAKTDYFVGKAKVTLTDTLPYPIDITKSELNGGTYNPENHTITWVEEVNNINTMETQTPKEIAITKQFQVTYKYGNLDEILVTNSKGTMVNTVNSKIELQKPKEDDNTQYETVKEEEKEAEKTTDIEIPANVIVHHYIYDKETDTYTTIKLAEDENISGIIGKEYTTTPSEEVAKDYKCINQTPDKYQGKMTENTIEVIYYYQLDTPTVMNEIEKEVRIENKETTEPILTREDGTVIYHIKYTSVIANYIGRTTIKIVDTLPAKINVEKSDIAGGKYDEKTQTITWIEEIEEINTYENNNIYVKETNKEIRIVYKEQDVTKDLDNKVTGTTMVYYPENHSSNPGKEQIVKEATDTAKVKQEYKAELQLSKKWDDSDNKKEKRPQAIQLTIYQKPLDGVEKIELNQENDWTYVMENQPKYTENGEKITYEVTEQEINKNDLEYYEEPDIKLIETQTDEKTSYLYNITNAYRLLETDLHGNISKTGTEEITSSTQKVEYTLHYEAEIVDYIGEGRVRIIDTLPYQIEEELSNLNGGIYNEEEQTITWEEELPHINTVVAKESYKIDITKNLEIVYKNLDATQEKMTNIVNGRVVLYETDEKDEKEATFDTDINVKGKVIVKYVDKDSGEIIVVNDEPYTYEIIDKVGKDYVTEKKEIENYDYIESTNNETGKIKEGEQEVIYYYSRIKTSVLVKHQDREGKPLAEDELIEGKIWDPYTTHEKEIENYRLYSVTENKEGTMEKDQIVVVYVYEKIPTKVIVKHLEKGTEKELAETEIIEGVAGDQYETERKIIPNYQTAEPEPENANGKMKPEEIEVIYYYSKIPSGMITVKYIDIDTQEEITYSKENEDGSTQETTYGYEVKGYVGEEYTTDKKEIPYYNYVKSTENTKGTLTQNDDTVIYYYRKLSFNMKIDKWVSQVEVNGNTKNEKTIKTKDQISKIEIHRKAVENTNIKIIYKIRVTNTGEIEGTASEIQENIPVGFSFNAEDNSTKWVNKNGTLITQSLTDENIQPGEYKELEIVLRWDGGAENFGTKDNEVILSKTSNPAGYEDTNPEDDRSKSSVLISVATGKEAEIQMMIILAVLIILMISCAVLSKKLRDSQE